MPSPVVSPTLIGTVTIDPVKELKFGIDTGKTPAGVAVAVEVAVFVGVGVKVDVLVGVGVKVAVAELVGEIVGVKVEVTVGTTVGVKVGVNVGVFVAVFVVVGVKVAVLVGVGVWVAVLVGVEVFVAVGVGVSTVTLPLFSITAGSPSLYRKPGCGFDPGSTQLSKVNGLVSPGEPITLNLKKSTVPAPTNGVP